MNTIYRASLALAGALAMFVAGAATAGALDDFHQFISQTHSARGTFTQSVVSRAKKATVSSGEFVFARPGKFRWSYEKPYQQVIVADGTSLTIYDKDLNQVSVRKLTDALGSTPAAILFGDNALEKVFDLSEGPSHDGLDWLDATPKSRDTTFAKISIGFRGGDLVAMELHDALGQVTQLQFADIKRNPPLEADAFKFVPPPGADVLQN